MASLSAVATSDLADVRCASDEEGSWSFEATIKNPGDTLRHYSVAVAVMVNASPQGHFTLTVDVPAGGTTPVVAKDFAVSADPGAVCEPVMSVEG